MLAWLLLALAGGSAVYCVLVVVATRRYLAVQPLPGADHPPISVLRPLAGLDDGLEQNLRSLLAQDYPHFEMLFAVRSADDPATALVERLRVEYPHIPSQLILTGEPPYVNAKVWSLEMMTAASAHELLVMIDSDVRVGPGFLRTIAAEFHPAEVGVSTCPYRAIGGPSMWSRLEAAGMNTEFIGGVLVARMIEGMKFALGPALAARKQVIADVGGWRHLSEFLAEDFVLGHAAAERGWRVLLSSCVVEHRIGSQERAANFRHRLRWYRSTRRSRPAGYVGQLFTNPTPLALLLLIAAPHWWMAAAVTLALRAISAAVACRALGTRLSMLVWPQDLLSFGFWIAGFFGNTVLWRGRRYLLLPDGRFRLIR